MSGATLTEAASVEAIERATVAAVAPANVETMADDAGNLWLLPIDPGTVGRAHSAVPLSHVQGPRDAPAWIEQVQARYAAHGLPACWRLADVPAFDGLRQALQARGHQSVKPTLTLVASVQQMHDAFAESADGSDAVQVASRPDADWARVFLGPGFDPVDGESRVQSLSRGIGNQFVSARFDGRTVAVGTLSIASGWASVHGLRTESASRGQGWASRILHAMARAALQRGAHDVFLQVEQDNAVALALYRRAGFRDAWRYRYWARTD